MQNQVTLQLSNKGVFLADVTSTHPLFPVRPTRPPTYIYIYMFLYIYDMHAGYSSVPSPFSSYIYKYISDLWCYRMRVYMYKYTYIYE